jgi:hypothetical protein
MLIFDVVKVEDHLELNPYPLGRGRPPLDSTAMARAFIAKAVLNLPTTRALRDRLNADSVLRRICGFERKAMLPCEASFSNSSTKFADAKLAERVHEALVREAHQGVLVHNMSRDSTGPPRRRLSRAKSHPRKLQKRSVLLEREDGRRRERYVPPSHFRAWSVSRR